MPELEFLPDWYPRLRIMRRRFVLGIASVSVLAIALSTGLSSAGAVVQRDEQTLAQLNHQLAATQGDLEKLRHLTRLRDQWLGQESVLRQAGVHIEASRLIASIGHALPAEVSLLQCSFAIEESDARPATGPAAMEETSEAAAPRRLKVKLIGVAPGELGVAAFLTGLSQTPLFEHVNLTVAKDREQDGRTMREFEVTFVIDLSSAVEG